MDDKPGNRNYWPCLHCADRTLGCHGVCKDYLEAAEARKKEKAGNTSNRNPIVTERQFERVATTRRIARDKR